MFIVAFFKNDWHLHSEVLEHSNHYDGKNQISFAGMAIMSLLLTVANVLMVAIGSCLLFRIKEVLPVEKKIFWDDLKTARRMYQVRNHFLGMVALLLHSLKL